MLFGSGRVVAPVAYGLELVWEVHSPPLLCATKRVSYWIGAHLSGSC